MTIIFEPEEDTLYAVAYDEILKGYLHQELMYAEIDPALGGFMVRFEDSYSDPHHCSTLEEAKEFVLKNYSRHNPRSMKRNFYLG